MFGLELSQTTQAIVALLILATMLVLFIRETYAVETIAIGGAGMMLVLGILPTADIKNVLSNNAPWTIVAMFMIVGGLVRTGALDWFGQLAASNVEKHPALTLGLMAISITGVSAFVNNTPLVVVMMPIFIQLAKQLSVSPSRLLMPLSYFTILGGTITMIGTSTNLVVDGVARDAGLAPFRIFELAPVGICVAIAGLIYIALFAKRILPERDTMATLLSDRSRMKFFTEVALPDDSVLIGKKLDEVDAFKRGDARVIDVLRGDASLRRDLSSVVLEVGDRVVLRTPMREILGLQANKDLRLVDRLSSVQTETVEVLITPGCRMIGRSLGSMRLRRRYGVYPLALHRRNQNIGRQLEEVVIQVGDTLLLEGAREDIQRLATDMELVDVSHPTEQAFRRKHAPIVVAVLFAVVAGATLDIAPIQVLAFLGVATILVTRCVDSDEALGSVDGRLMAMLFGMLAVGQGLEHSGAVEMLVKAIAPYLMGMQPWVLVAVVYALTSFLTEIVSNNAVAVIVTPVVIALSQALGVDPRPLVIVVMIGASASFATPIGYQTNTLVYGPGGYKFADFFWFGVPLNLLSLVVVTAVVPLLYDF